MFSITAYNYTYVKITSTYSSYQAQTKLIYDDIYLNDDVKASSPKLDISENAAGTFTIKLAPTNNGYSIVEKLKTQIIITKNSNVIWSGRIISIKEDFQKNKTITCEGALAYLNDTIQPQEFYENYTVGDIIMALIYEHNDQIGNNGGYYKKFEIGILDSSICNQVVEEYYTNYEDTLSALNNIVSAYGGYIKLTYSRSATIINYYAETNRTHVNQVISFGRNLLDFTKSYDISDFCTAVMPLGARIDNQYGISSSGIDGVQAYTTIESVNGGSVYYQDDTAVNNYGFLLKKLNFDDEIEPSYLLQYAKNYLSSEQFDAMTIEVSAADLSYLESYTEELDLSKTVRVLSIPHGLDKVFPIKKVSIPLDNPGESKFTMTLDIVGKLSANGISGQSASTNNYVNYSVEKITNDILLKERRNQANLISSFSTGYITITNRKNGSNELYITDQKIPSDWNADDPGASTTPGMYKDVKKYWRWNFNGLEYVNKEKNLKNGDDENLSKVAISIDGTISADFITTGRLNASVVNAGILKNYECTDNADAFGNNSSRKDIFFLDLEKGILKMNATNLTIGGYSAATQSYVGNQITNYDQNLGSTAILNKIRSGWRGIQWDSTNGFYISADYIYSGSLTLGGNNNKNGILKIQNSSGIEIGRWDNSGLYVNGGSITTENNSSKIVIEQGLIKGYYSSTLYGNISIGQNTYSSTTYVKDVKVNGKWTYKEQVSYFTVSGIKIDTFRDYGILLSGNNLILDFYSSNSDLNSKIKIGYNVYNNIYKEYVRKFVNIPQVSTFNIINNISTKSKYPYVSDTIRIKTSYTDNIPRDLNIWGGDGSYGWSWYTVSLVDSVWREGDVSLTDSASFIYDFSYYTDTLKFVHGLQIYASDD